MKTSGNPKRSKTPTKFSRRTVLGMAAAATFARPALAQDTKSRTLRFVPSGNLGFLDPNTSYAPTVTHGRAVFDTLYGVDNQFRPRPQMIEGQQVSDDKKVWTFRLREGLKFHDGEPVRGRDCVASIARWAKRDSFGLLVMTSIDHMESTEDRTFKIYLKQPVGPLVDALARPTGIPLCIMPERLAQTDPFKQIPEIIGSGPYRFLQKEYVSGNRAVYERFDGYVPRTEAPEWTAGAKIANFDRIEWIMIPDTATAISALKSGEVDWLNIVQPELVPSVVSNSNLVVAGSNRISTLLGFNFQNPPFNNVALRRALRDAVNQEDFVQAIVGDDPKLYQICHSVFGCGLPGVVEMTAPSKSFEESKKAISAAGYKGEKIVMLDSTDYSFLSSGARIGADLMKRLGMNVELQSMDFATLMQRRTNMEPVEKGGWSMFCTAADLPALQNPGVNYYVRTGWAGAYKNEEIDRLTQQWLSATESAEAQRTFEQIQRVSYDDVPMIQLGFFDLRTAHSKNLTGVLPCSSAVFWNVKRV